MKAPLEPVRKKRKKVAESATMAISPSALPVTTSEMDEALNEWFVTLRSAGRF